MKINGYSDVIALDVIPRPLTSAPMPSAVPANPLLDSMEEVALKFSESVERHSKSLDQRSIAQPSQARRVERIEKLAELYSLLDRNDQPSLDQLARRMQIQLQQQPSLEAALSLGDNDPARTDILLQQALRLSMKEGDESTVGQTRSLIEELRQLHGEKIRAGFNTAGAIALFSRDPEQRAAMRQLYYKAVVGQQSLASLLEALLERFSEEQFTRGLRTLQRALADDFAALAPSLPGAVLGSMLRGLGSCGQLSNLLHTCNTLLRRLALKHPGTSLTSLALGKRVLRFCGNGFFARDLTLLTEEAVGSTRALHPLFLNGLYPLLQSLPLVLWKDLKTRQNGLRLLQNLMDEQARQERKALGLDQPGFEQGHPTR
ncbi:type III secretion system gatekeeper subunit SctW [Pseudomonas fluorescens]|uniref:Type III secretion system gatekeeper subunit SctW n=1 Tax=Pseudomonas fluorescens TaxID=294 RepID=A0A944HBZ6_PSEFL|nr:type III secretion system gatekeeper subunit SctW [Pseudomonas fluorescens]MBT2298534.1 type III secretion system gatekeeper subunit SctW [Pseudomonas fluorescens]MBT2310059.1 type III secretion system gatekeeper subunit SctW [Pseudomonas fluorescens]MBT2311083.1 type III secretion system gatekeeper subunit SctW [Pseudomonas fluorescens]MBT2319982.1 type III secretion system gatekeeper subunit SctW [Pseudomonas fluorescens]MBT2328990.1 type III secretion system gatekeeper subunit SctW [Pseu